MLSPEIGVSDFDLSISCDLNLAKHFQAGAELAGKQVILDQSAIQQTLIELGAQKSEFPIHIFLDWSDPDYLPENYGTVELEGKGEKIIVGHVKFSKFVEDDIDEDILKHITRTGKHRRLNERSSTENIRKRDSELYPDIDDDYAYYTSTIMVHELQHVADFTHPDKVKREDKYMNWLKAKAIGYCVLTFAPATPVLAGAATVGKHSITIIGSAFLMGATLAYKGIVNYKGTMDKAEELSPMEIRAYEAEKQILELPTVVSITDIYSEQA